MEKTKYFKSIPDQEYVFKNFFTTGKKNGMCCSDCGTYITNVVQVIGKADRQSYYLGTTCCEKISKDRTVFLTPASVQRKKIFMKQFKKFQKIRKELDLLAEENGGAIIKWADVRIDWASDLNVTLFNFCKNGLLVRDDFDICQRCFSGLKELTDGYQFDMEMGNILEQSWSNETYRTINNLINSSWQNLVKDDNAYWYNWFKKNHPEQFNIWKNNRNEASKKTDWRYL